jgi:hypothetical protein
MCKGEQVYRLGVYNHRQNDRCSSLGFETLAHRRGAQRGLALLEGFTDVIDRVVLIAEADNEIVCGRLLGLGAGSVLNELLQNGPKVCFGLTNGSLGTDRWPITNRGRFSRPSAFRCYRVRT